LSIDLGELEVGEGDAHGFGREYAEAIREHLRPEDIIGLRSKHPRIPRYVDGSLMRSAMTHLGKDLMHEEATRMDLREGFWEGILEDVEVQEAEAADPLE
jgi:hypothetical protein